MKIRNGFVSNSSSASFIITWRCLDPMVKDSVDALKKLFSRSNVNKEEIASHTCELKSGAYRTMFCTSMMNSYDDFGPDAAYMMMLLYLDFNYEIVDARVESD